MKIFKIPILDLLIFTFFINNLEFFDNIVSTIKKALETKLQQSVTIEVMMDEGLIGGAKIQIGDNMIDASIRSQINELGRILTN